MSKIHSYPKIFTLGSDWIPSIFKGHVEVTEKIDGSMFAFGLTPEGELVMRSKGKEQFKDGVDKMFNKAATYAESVVGNLESLMAREKCAGIYFYGEFLGSPSHNVLKYGRTPENHIMVFGVKLGEAWVKDYDKMKELAECVGLETVPLLYSGELPTINNLHEFFTRESVLGVEMLEGVVVKNYNQPVLIGEQVFPSLGKYVRAEFKERHAKDWSGKFSDRDKLEKWLDSFKTEARWHKAVQHLRDDGKLTNEPKDIGLLMKEVERDVLEEEELAIKNELFKLFKDQVVRKSRSGLPEWYKEELVKKAFATSGGE